MEQLRELEKRVLDIIQKNKKLQEETNKLKAENVRLQGQYETSKSMAQEKASIKTSIEGLLKTIKSLETASSE